MNDKKEKTENYLLGMDKDSLKRYELFDEIYQPATEERFSTLQIKPNMNILEVGCGIGQTAIYMAKNIVPEGNVIAFDQAQSLVDTAKYLASHAGLKNITFLCAKAQEYDYEQEYFDLVHTRYVLTYSPYATQIMIKIYESLKFNGTFFGEEVYQAYAMHNQPKWFDNIREWFRRLIEIGGGNPNYGLEKMPSDMLEAGFRDLNITAYLPVSDQSKIIKMLKLALSHEMKKSLIDHGIASADEIEASIEEMTRQSKESLISSSMNIQAIGFKVKDCKENYS